MVTFLKWQMKFQPFFLKTMAILHGTFYHSSMLLNLVKINFTFHSGSMKKSWMTNSDVGVVDFLLKVPLFVAFHKLCCREIVGRDHHINWQSDGEYDGYECHQISEVSGFYPVVPCQTMYSRLTGHFSEPKVHQLDEFGQTRRSRQLSLDHGVSSMGPLE